MGGSKQYASWPHRVTSSFPHCGDASAWHELRGRLSTLCPFSLASFPSFGSRDHQEDRSWIFPHPRVGNSANQCWGQLSEDDYRGDSSQPAQLEYLSGEESGRQKKGVCDINSKREHAFTSSDFTMRVVQPQPPAPLSGLTEQPLGPRNQVKPPALYAYSATPPFTAFQSILLTARWWLTALLHQCQVGLCLLGVPCRTSGPSFPLLLSLVPGFKKEIHSVGLALYIHTYATLLNPKASIQLA